MFPVLYIKYLLPRLRLGFSFARSKDKSPTSFPPFDRPVHAVTASKEGFSKGPRHASYTISLQESRFEHAHQISGPAGEYWQFESSGATKGVMKHPASREHARSVCKELGVSWKRPAIFDAIETGTRKSCILRPGGSSTSEP